jgi:hypothetical protein
MNTLNHNMTNIESFARTVPGFSDEWRSLHTEEESHLYHNRMLTVDSSMVELSYRLGIFTYFTISVFTFFSEIS